MRFVEIFLCTAIGAITAFCLVVSRPFPEMQTPIPVTAPALAMQQLEGCNYVVQMGPDKKSITSSYPAVAQPSTCLYDARKPR